MAQVVSQFSGTVTGGATIYYYKNPDDTSTPTRIYNGTGVTLPVNWETTIQNNMVRIVGPGKGWMWRWNVTNITPVYTTVTDKCTPPSSVTLNTSTKVLTVNGGAGGDLNTLVGWGVNWRGQQIGASTWGAWSGDTLITGRTLNVTAPAGYTRQFRARTRGSAGASYFSDYVVCPTTLVGNTVPSGLTILIPASGASTHSQIPRVILFCPPDAEGDAMTLRRQIDSESWEWTANLPSSGGTVINSLPTLSTGSHTIRYLLRDANGLETPAVSVTITVTLAIWGRTISAGTIIAAPGISHQSDIQGLLTAVNKQRTYYGLANATLPGQVGNFSDWKDQMETLQNAVDTMLSEAGATAPNWLNVPPWPTAAVITQLRGAVGLA